MYILSSEYLLPQFSVYLIGYFNNPVKYEEKLILFFCDNINKEKKVLREYIINLSYTLPFSIREKIILLISTFFKDYIKYSFVKKHLKKEFNRGNIDDYSYTIKEYDILK